MKVKEDKWRFASLANAAVFLPQSPEIPVAFKMLFNLAIC